MHTPCASSGWRSGATPAYADAWNIFEQIVLRDGVAETAALTMREINVPELVINGKEETGKVR